MKITAIQTGVLRTPLKTPFKTALRQVETMEEVVVLVHTDKGYTGYGSAPPTPPITGETVASITHAIQAHIRPALIGKDVDHINRNTALVQASILHNSSAKAAVDMALYDLWGQLHKAPLYQLLGGGEPVLRTDITISVNSVEHMVDDALLALQQGFDCLKIKLGQHSQLDSQRVRAIYEAVKGKASLRLDANQGWNAPQAVHIMRALERDGLELELLEQPVKAKDIEGLKYVSQHISTPVMADESVFSARQALYLLQHRAAGIFNIKLMKTGGLHQALRVADVAAMYQAPCMIGCMLESVISVSAAAHLAVARKEVISKIDLDGPSLAQANWVEGGAIFDGPQIHLSAAPGLGIKGVKELDRLVG